MLLRQYNCTYHIPYHVCRDVESACLFWSRANARKAQQRLIKDLFKAKVCTEQPCNTAEPNAHNQIGPRATAECVKLCGVDNSLHTHGRLAIPFWNLYLSAGHKTSSPGPRVTHPLFKVWVAFSSASPSESFPVTRQKEETTGHRASPLMFERTEDNFPAPQFLSH